MEKEYEPFSEEVRHRFDYHAPDEIKTQKHKIIREATKIIAQEFHDFLPSGREKALAMTKLEEALMWANAAIARD